MLDNRKDLLNNYLMGQI